MKTGFAALLALSLCAPAFAAGPALSPIEQLGRAVFFDASLSEPAGQSCASCHAPEAGFAFPDSSRNAREGTAPGAIAGRSGNRSVPTIAYTSFTPLLHWDEKQQSYVGGLFRDGRAKDLEDQAKGPFVNPVEMNNLDGEAVCKKVTRAGYAGDFRKVFAEPLNCKGKGFDHILAAIAAYEGSAEVNPFSSKYDAYLRGQTTLTAQEKHGLELFQGPAKCERCHVSKPGPQGQPPLFTDFGYDNIGAPKNPDNPFYRQSRDVNARGVDYIDPGLGMTIRSLLELGKFKTPTLRNVAMGGDGFTHAYFHNGSLKSLEEVMTFYNRRDEQPARWPAEEPRNINKLEMGRLNLSPQDEQDIVAFLKTLDDGWQPSTSVNSLRVGDSRP